MNGDANRIEERPTQFYDLRNASTRIDMFEELSHTALAALREFTRRLKAPHLVDEVILPTLEDGDSLIYAAVRDRPWPPWGLGARHISALCQVQAVGDESYAVSPVYVADEDLNNVGLIAAVYKEVLEGLAVSEVAEVNYLAAEGSTLANHVFTSTGLKLYDDVFLTEEARYYTYRIEVRELLKNLGLAELETPDLLAHDLPTEVLKNNALFHSTILQGARPEWTASAGLAEIIRLVRGGHASKPGGVPSGTNRFGWQERFDPDIPPIFVSLENFLGDARGEALEFLVKNENRFKPATVSPQDREKGVDERLRRSKTLNDLGPLEKLVEEKIRENLERVLRILNHPAFPLGRIEVQATASGDGDFFRMHRDKDPSDTRELTFVYYLYREPRRFSGGELRLFDGEVVKGELLSTDRTQILSPRQDVAVFFPSITEHEILPIRVPTKSFGDSRFTINGWIHRAD